MVWSRTAGLLGLPFGCWYFLLSVSSESNFLTHNCCSASTDRWTSLIWWFSVTRWIWFGGAVSPVWRDLYLHYNLSTGLRLNQHCFQDPWFVPTMYTPTGFPFGPLQGFEPRPKRPQPVLVRIYSRTCNDFKMFLPSSSNHRQSWWRQLEESDTVVRNTELPGLKQSLGLEKVLL